MLRTFKLPLALLVFAVGCGARTAPGPLRDAGGSGPNDAGSLPDVGPIDATVVDAAICGGSCDDGLFCNGVEVCTEDGCLSVAPPDCDDGDECTDDSCSDGARACVHTPNDVDRDRDGITSCRGDCDDNNPGIGPGQSESCDALDNDCDGRIDEGALSECGDCRPCEIIDLPGDTRRDWLDAPNEHGGVETEPDGSLRLAQTRSERSFGWIANTAFATITKLDLRNGNQSAEYDAVLLDGTNHARPIGERCISDPRSPQQGNCPSRTAVDLRGAVYIANRAFGHQSTVTKIAGLEEDCIDRNGNGRIDTSRDMNGNGIIEEDVDGEFLGQADECLLWTVDVGRDNGIARAIAVDARGFVWVGLYESRQVIQLDPDDGSIVRELSVGHIHGFHPYGAAIGSDGKVWFVEVGTGRIIAVDTITGVIGSPQVGENVDRCTGNYGIAIDEENRIWLAGFSCESIMRYDPRLNIWREFDLPYTGTRGVAADGDGHIYVSASHTFININRWGFNAGEPITRLFRMNTDGTDFRVYGEEVGDLPGLGSVGIGLDGRRRVWLINQESGTATRFDPETETAREFPVGEQPYTYSDFTGYALRTFTAPNGTWSTVVDGCPGGITEWESAQVEGDFPAGTRFELRFRSANTRSALSSQSWVGPFDANPADLSAAPIGDGALLEVQLTLVSEDEEATPRVRNLAIQRNCPLGL